MYNTDIPTRAELPTSAQLLRSTAIALAVAGALLVTVVLPSEYAIDPTGVGRALGLTQMGEVKTQLAKEAEADAAADASAEPKVAAVVPSVPVRSVVNEHGHDHTEGVVDRVAAPAPLTAPTPMATGRSDQLSLVLKPGQGAEVKMAMAAGARASFKWSANGGVVNVDAHGDGGGRSISYKKRRSVGEDTGEIVAAFDGYHGWFWRNRTDRPVTMTLQTQGDYKSIKRME